VGYVLTWPFFDTAGAKNQERVLGPPPTTTNFV
jgi:hypothetical protein